MSSNNSNNKKQQQQIRRDDVEIDTEDGTIMQGDEALLTTDPAPTEDSPPPTWIPFASNPLFSANKVVVPRPLQNPPAPAQAMIATTVKDQARSVKARATADHQKPTGNTKDGGPDYKDQVHPVKEEPMKQEKVSFLLRMMRKPTIPRLLLWMPLGAIPSPPPTRTPRWLLLVS